MGGSRFVTDRICMLSSTRPAKPSDRRTPEGGRHDSRAEPACGKEFGSPPFPFPPPGAPPPALRLGHCTGPKHNAHPRSGPVRKRCSLLGGYAAPKPPLAVTAGPASTLSCKPDRSSVNKTGHLDKLTTACHPKQVSASTYADSVVCQPRAVSESSDPPSKNIRLLRSARRSDRFLTCTLVMPAVAGDG